MPKVLFNIPIGLFKNMAWIKSIIQTNLPQFVVNISRGIISRRNLFQRPLFFSSYLRIHQRCLVTQDVTTKPAFDITEMSGKSQFSKNDPVVAIAKQIGECAKGVRSKSGVLDNYSKLKKAGMLSGGDFVRILVRLAKFYHSGQDKREKVNADLLYEGLLEDIKKNSTHFKAFQLADIIWSLGKLNKVDKKWLVYFGSIVESKKDLTDFSNADLAMVLWGHGKTNNAAPIVFSRIQKEIFRRGVQEFTTRELCQIVWSFARVMRTSAKLFAAVRKVIQKRNIAEFNNQDLIMLMWAYSEAGVNVKPLFRYFKSELLNSKRLSDCGTKDLSLVLWSFSNQGIKAQDLFEEVERELLTRERIALDDQSLVVIAWAYAHTDNKSPRLFKFLEIKLMSSELNDWSLHRLARILWAFTKTGFLTKKLLERITNAMLFHNFAELSQNGLEEVVFALQFCKHAIPGKLVSAVEAELMKRAKEINT